MSISIQEPGICFGPFEEAQLFHIEKSKGYTEIKELPQIAEFLWLSTNSEASMLWIVEAKSSIPREHKDFFIEIQSKLVNALTLTISGCLKRNLLLFEELPSSFKQLDWSSVDIKLVLVVPDIPKEHLPQITDKFKKTMITTRNTWKIKDISTFVLNREQAEKFGLVSA
jgi:hypothetical protein